MLLAIFSMFCFKCKRSKPSVNMKQNGTMVTVYQNCFHCGENAFVWRSQPLLLGKYPAGNILLSFAILMAGASISKILLVFKHMSLCMYSIRTCFIHQDKLLFPVILTYWESYRLTLFNQLKNMKDVVCSGRAIWLNGSFGKIWGVYHILLHPNENCPLWVASGKLWLIQQILVVHKTWKAIGKAGGGLNQNKINMTKTSSIT